MKPVINSIRECLEDFLPAEPAPIGEMLGGTAAALLGALFVFLACFL